MSADNWRKCPKCKADAVEKAEAKRRKAATSYGKVPADEYAKLLAEAGKPVKLEDEFREDYEIGVTEDFKFYVIYRGGCETCDFEVTYRLECDSRKMPKPTP